MKTKFFHFLPLLFIFLFWFIFSSPFFLKGEVPFTGDYQVTFFPPWSQYSQFARPVKNNAMPDVIDQIYPWKHLVVSDWKNGEIPLWNPYQFAGTPLLANNQSAAFSPMNLLFFVFPFKVGWGLLILLQPLMAGVGTYLFAKKIKISQIGATLSAVAFMFCGFMTSWMGYGTLGYAISVLPFVMLGLEGYLQSRLFAYLALSSMSLAFSFVSGHFQISLYLLFVAFSYFLFRYLPPKSMKLLFFGFTSLVLGVCIALIQIFPSVAFYIQSLRSTLFQRPEIIPWQYLLTVVAPDFFGNPVTRNGWFGHYAEWNSYIGVLPFLFALFSLTEIRKNKFVLFFFGLGLISLLLATPTFLGDLILQLHVPVLATSAAGRIIVLFSFSLAVLSGFGIDAWVKASDKKKMFLGGAGLAFFLFYWAIILGKFGFSSENMLVAKQNFYLPSFFLLSSVGACIVAVFFKKRKILLAICFILLILSASDMYRFASKWQSFSPENLIFPDVGVTKFFQSIKNDRALGNYGGQVSLYYQIPSIEGYDALYPERFGEFASYIANGTLQPASRSVVDFPKNGTYTKEAINLLGVQYIIQKVSDSNKPWAFPVWENPTNFSVVYQDNNYLVFQNKNAFPRTFITGDYIVEKNDKKTLSVLFTQSTNPRRELILSEDPHIPKISSLSAKATIDSYASEKVIITSESPASGLLFLSDTFFPGWHAYVDGKQTKILQADYAFRAITVPAGKHTVIFSYWPDNFIYGLMGTIEGLATLLCLYFLQKKIVW